MDAPKPLHLLKLCVGASSVEDLSDWQDRYAAAARAEGRDATLRHVTRQWPKRAGELLSGGSLYWVFKGLTLARQRILTLEAWDQGDEIDRCAIVLEPAIVRTEPQPRRPFQGWRYLTADDAPRDLAAADDGAALPDTLREALAEFGVGRRTARCG